MLARNNRSKREEYHINKQYVTMVRWDEEAQEELVHTKRGLEERLVTEELGCLLPGTLTIGSQQGGGELILSRSHQHTTSTAGQALLPLHFGWVQRDEMTVLLANRKEDGDKNHQN